THPLRSPVQVPLVEKPPAGYHPPAMEHAPAAPAGGATSSPRRFLPLWTVLFLALLAWQGWMTLTLFGYDRPWQRLLDDQPILSGRHPLHLYHGYLGACALLPTGR